MYISPLNRLSPLGGGKASATQKICQYSLSGADEYISYGNILNSVTTGATPTFSVNVWVKRNGIGTNQYIVSKWGASGNFGWFLRFNTDNTIQLTVSGNGTGQFWGHLSSETFTDTSNWHLISATFDGSLSEANIIKIYIDGEQITTSTAGLFPSIYSTTAPLEFGGRNGAGFLDADLRPISIHNDVLSDSELLAMFNNGNVTAPPSDNLSLYSTFKNDTWDGGNWVVVDESINENDGATVNVLENERICESVPIYENLIDNDSWFNSVLYSDETTYEKRSAFSEIRFNYSGTLLGIKCKTTGAGGTNIPILIDGAYHAAITAVDDRIVYITLPSGSKTVGVCQTILAGETLDGSFFKNIIVDSNKASILTESGESERFVFLGDSITQGISTTTRITDGYAQRYRFDGGKNATYLGYASATMNELASTVGKITTTVGWITSAFANTTTTKKLVILLGTNDFKLDGTAEATFIGWYEDLLDAINVADSNIDVYCITPTIRTDDGTLLDDYRTAITSLCGTKSFATALDGKSMITVSELADSVHPNNDGHEDIYIDSSAIIL